MKFSASNIPPLGIAHFTVIDVEPLAFVGLAHRAGYQAIGLRLHPAFPRAPFYAIPVGSTLMKTMKAKLADTGLTVYDIEFVVLDEQLQIESVTPMLESAAELGAKRLSVCGDIADQGKMVGRFAELCQLAARFDMGVDLEIMVWRKVSSLEIAASVVRDAAQANGAILIDALHLSRSGGTPEKLRALPSSFIRSVQLCDARTMMPESNEAIIQEARGGRLLPGEGALPLLSLLAEIPDHAMLSVEVPNTGNSAEQHAQRVFEATTCVIRAAALKSKE